MKNLLLTVIIALTTLTSFAQTPDQSLARVKYRFIHLRDTTQKDNPYTETMLLVIGKNASVYTSFDKIGRDLNLPGTREPGKPFKPVNNTDYYSFFKENKFFTRDKLITNYVITEETSKINWKITKDTTTILGIKCQRATTNFKGRNWIAWYATDLPFQSGPWKLNGLPGLIIEAYDDKKDVQFKMDGFDNLKDKAIDAAYAINFFYGEQVKFPDDVKTTTRAEFDKLKKAFDDDPRGFIAAAEGISKDKVFIGSSPSGVSHKVINNPIELPERK